MATATVTGAVFSTTVSSARRVAILGTSGLVGLAGAYAASFWFLAGDIAPPLHLASAHAFVFAVLMLMQFAVVLFVPGVLRLE